MTLEVDAEFFGQEARIWNDAAATLEIEWRTAPGGSWPTVFREKTINVFGEGVSEFGPVDDMGMALKNTQNLLSETAYTTANTLRASARAYLANENASVDEINRLAAEYGL